MILGGHGSVLRALNDAGARRFAGLYALYSDCVLVTRVLLATGSAPGHAKFLGKRTLL